MSFLDNCGTILLDAILTDLGRKRMSQGKFEVKKFALGDDEINYGLFLTNTSYEPILADNSRNEDRRILSQSCFEAFNNNSAVINYGLTAFERNDLLYLPVLKLNYSGSASDDSKRPDYIGQPEEHSAFARPSGSVFHLSVNKETTNKLKSALGGTNYILESNNISNTKIIIESGIDSTEVSATKANRDTFILEMGLLDVYYNIYADSRFFAQTLSSKPTAKFRSKIDGNLDANFTPLEFNTKVSLETVIDKFDVYLAQGAPNHIYNLQDAKSDLNVSVIRGPRGSVLALGFMTLNELGGSSTATRDAKYSTFGKTDQTLFGGSDKYDYIDSTIYVMGATSGARIEVPLRIIRYAGT